MFGEAVKIGTMDAIGKHWTTIKDALGPHWLRYVLVWGLGFYAIATNAESFLRGRGVTFLPTLYSSAFVFVVGIIWLVWHLVSYATAQRLILEPKFNLYFGPDEITNEIAIGAVQAIETKFLRLRVDALTNANVKISRAAITEISVLAATTDEWEKLPLQPIDIGSPDPIARPGLPLRLKFLRTSRHDGVLAVTDNIEWPNKFNFIFFEIGTFHVTIAVNGEGCGTRHIKIELKWGGKWDEIKGRQLAVW